MLNRFDFERAVASSDLAPLSKLVLLMVTFAADWPGGKVPARYARSLTDLASMTGMARSTVATHLNRLEKAGWISRKRPTVERARSMKERTEYRLRVPPAASPPVGLEASPGDGPASPGDGPELVREPDWASPGAGHKPDLFQTYPDQAARAISEKTGATDEEAAELAKRIKVEREPKSLIGLVLKMAKDGDLMRMLSDYRLETRKKRNIALIENARKNGPDCIHGDPGGAFLHPLTGLPLCVDCRLNALRTPA